LRKGSSYPGVRSPKNEGADQLRETIQSEIITTSSRLAYTTRAPTVNRRPPPFVVSAALALEAGDRVLGAFLITLTPLTTSFDKLAYQLAKTAWGCNDYSPENF
jgi:hypothetical protein